MRGKVSKRLRSVAVEYTSKPLSGWGGLIALNEFFEQIGLRESLEQALPDGRTSNNLVPVVDLIIQFLVTVLIGGKRFQHVDRIKHDETIRRVMNAERFGGGSTLTRYLGNLTQGQGEHIDQTLSRLVMGGFLSHVGRDVLDLDSTILERYGSQEGVTKGYSPNGRSRKSHHPLAAMLAGSKIVPHVWLRQGAVSPHNGILEFLTELRSKLPEDFVIEAVRADAGFYSRKVMDYLEDANIPFVIPARMHPAFMKWCASRTGWKRVDDQTEITEDIWVAPKATDRPRRMVIVRTVKKVEEGLFTVIHYDYTALATTYAGPAEASWRFYRGRGDCENRFRELKGDYNIRGFCLKRFAGTEIAFRLICFLYNLVMIFKTAILRDITPTLGTLRTSVLVVGAALGSSGRKDILRLGLRDRWKERFERLLITIRRWSSTAAQFKQALENAVLEPPSCWRYRHGHMLRF